MAFQRLRWRRARGLVTMRLIVAACLGGAWGAAGFAIAQRSTPVQLLHPMGAAQDQFGNAVAVNGDTLIVGAPNDDVGANTDQGSAHIYRWTGTGWAFEATLTAAGGAANDYFGSAVAIAGDTVLVGAKGDDVGTNNNQGSAFVFVRTPGGTTWTQQAQLTATGGAADDLFGAAVALAADTALVGAHFDDVGGNADQGSAHVFTRSGATWTQQAQLTATGGAALDRFGYSVALGANGDTALVGAIYDDVSATIDQGSAYVFARTGSAWAQQAHLTASDGATSDAFGCAVALGAAGDTALIGALGDDLGSNANQGSAYVFDRAAGGTAWTQRAKITAADGAIGDEFGVSVALAGTGDTALVGANLRDVGPNSDQGSAYVFSRSGTVWTQQAQLTAPDGWAFDWFGFAVALDGTGDTAVIGSFLDYVGANANQGSAWVFSRVGSRWIGIDMMLLASDGAASDQFGYAVAIYGDTALVGAHWDDVGTNADQGSAYVFVRSGSTWIQQAKLTAIDGLALDHFGSSVAISGSAALVGAPDDDVGANENQGSAYVFTRAGTTWTQQGKLTASTGAAFDLFGWSVAIAAGGDITALVGARFGNTTGTAYVFVRPFGFPAWVEQAQLTAPGSSFFGSAVALGANGNTALVGADGENTAQGSAYVFSRSGSTWTQEARLTAADGAAGDHFGYSVALSGDTAIVGALSDVVGANTDQGSAHVFTRSGATWTQQAKLTADDGAQGDWFGISVAISSDTALVGASFDDAGVGTDNRGSAHVFTRSGTTWTRLARLTAADGAPGDSFGRSVALGGAGETALVGAVSDDIGGNTSQGSAWVFDVPASGFSLAHNDVTDVLYPTLAAALLPAQSGQQITATDAAWRGISNLDTAGRSLILRSHADLRTPSTSVMTLGGSSSLLTGAGSVADIFGQVRVSSGASADVTADAFTLGSSGLMTARTGSSLTINAPEANLDGQTRLEQGASLTFSGGATAIGPTACGLNSSLTVGSTFTNIDTFTITAGTLSMPLFRNRALTDVFGSSAIFGSYTNDAGATTTIRSGTLFVFGSLTNNGAIIGTICANCLGTPPNLEVRGDLALGPDADLIMPFPGSLVYVGGDFDCAINSSTRYDMALATMRMEGAGGEQTLEIMSTDIGPDADGLDRGLAGHYPVGVLQIGPALSVVRLVDAHDNDGLGQAVCEAVYVDELRIDAGSRLINTTCKVYYNTLDNGGTVDVPGNLVQIRPACPADFNGSGVVSVQDIFDFLAAYFAGCTGPGAPPCYASADFNGSGAISVQDIFDFLAAYFAGCP